MNLPLLCLVAASLSPLFRVASARQQTQRPFAAGSSTRNYTFVVDPSRLTVNNYAVHLMLESNINQVSLSIGCKAKALHRADDEARGLP